MNLSIKYHQPCLRRVRLNLLLQAPEWTISKYSDKQQGELHLLLDVCTSVSSYHVVSFLQKRVNQGGQKSYITLQRYKVQKLLSDFLERDLYSRFRLLASWWAVLFLKFLLHFKINIIIYDILVQGYNQNKIQCWCVPKSKFAHVLWLWTTWKLSKSDLPRGDYVN